MAFPFETTTSGRPFAPHGRARVASAVSGTIWAAELGRTDPSVFLPAADLIVQGWRAAAFMEHASVASFARFTLDLLAHGAPPELLIGAQQAALDEIEHARLCLGMVVRFGGEAVQPGALDMAGASAYSELVEAAKAALIEGAIGETLAAAEAARARDLAVDLEAKRVLSRIAADETRHAALAFQFVAWAVQRLGAKAARSLRVAGEEALSDRQFAADAPTPRPSEQVEAMHAAGRLTERERRAVSQATIEDVLRPCLADLGQSTHIA